MHPFRTMQTAGLLKGLLDLAYWAIVVLAPLYAALIVVSYLGPGDPDTQLGADVWFDPEPAWALQGDGARAAEIIGGEAAVRFQRLPWPELAVDLPVTGLFMGGALLVAAEAFRRGAQLEEEQAFTV
jgi:hypothetical protein